MDHIKTFQEVKAEDLSIEEISELVNIVKKKYRNVKTPMAENNNIFKPSSHHGNQIDKRGYRSTAGI